MPRRARVLLPGHPHHLTQRCHNRQPCFFQRSDYIVYLDFLREHSSLYGGAIHAYVLMTNHVHLLVTMDDVTMLAPLMKGVAQNYAQYINRRLKRTGSLWEDRFHSSPIIDDAYLLTCLRYVELNPVRATIVDSPARYRWSSYAGNAGLAADNLLTPHTTYLGLGSDPAPRFASYRNLFSEPLNPVHLQAIRSAAAGNRRIDPA
ncbi:REP-associated tyrosine transposase [Pseudoduganella umbonata]|uniref:Transposase n=1 Tax=Pseudoduganella umbonata TaxID=864828 RepID=A0A4V1EDH3_9BURK|nr:transposase [Pseudoduganella umbonata]MBB3224770.1 putative transposase [Pseudoduganella umbonata]QCP11081.1 transposase [Pseudoduganella umbonata]